jgi:hypothetical protein
MVSSGMLRRVALVRTDVLRSVRRLLVAANVVPSSPILVTLITEALGFSETSVLTSATRRNFPEDTILHSHRHENLKSYTGKYKFASPYVFMACCLPCLQRAVTASGGCYTGSCECHMMK